MTIDPYFVPGRWLLGSPEDAPLTDDCRNCAGMGVVEVLVPAGDGVVVDELPCPSPACNNGQVVTG